jgi:hypothetical protein
MLHFCPIEPVGHVVSDPPRTVHFCEHTGVGNWLNVFVHTPLVHSVLVSLTVMQPEPKAALFEPEPEPDPALSTGGGLLPLLQATATATDKASTKTKALCISKSYRVPECVRHIAY